MATKSELHEALNDYTERAKASARVKKTLGNWNCVLHIQASDMPEAAFTSTIKSGELVSVEEGLNGKADLIVEGNAEDLANIFWGDADPASNYMQGAIKTKGSQDDVMKLDAMAMFIFLGQ